MADDPLDELRKRLYKQGESFERRFKRPGLSPDVQKAPLSWKEPPALQQNNMPAKKKNSRSYWWGLAIALVILISGVTYYFISYGTFSPNKIDFRINAPENIDGGEKMTWEVSVSNNNSKSLESMEIIFEYPEGSKILDADARGTRTRRAIGFLGPGEMFKSTFEAFIFGEEGSEKTAHATLEFRPSDSSAVLAKETEFSVKISRSPIGISFEMPAEVKSGQDLELKINYTSNAKESLDELVLAMEYPPGFSFKKSFPESRDGGNSWLIRNLRPGQSGTIALAGHITGEDLEEKSFKASIGLKDRSNIYGAYTQTLKVRRPFLNIEVKVNGQKSLAVDGGDGIDAEIFYKNNLPVAVENATVELVFIGNGLNENQINPGGGTYRPSSKSVIWNASTQGGLRLLNPGDSGSFRAQFSFLDPPPIKNSADKNFKLLSEAKITPGKVPAGYDGTDTSGTDSAEVRLTSSLQLVSRGFYYSNIIPNSGPIPPRVGKETTFTIIWSLINSSNDLENVTVRAPLPSYMAWKGVVSPASQDVTYATTTGEIVWRVGSLKSGIGFISPAKEVAFQIAFTPSESHVGSAPIILDESQAQAFDTFVRENLSASADSINLSLPDDNRLGGADNRVLP
ncbi:hypothetical protein HYW53_01335 [Candidatus Giovannonibacteria bacterium]|nr:hypothetical protein [Candidatus Giovannonibacteria bacterium]